MRFGNRTPIEIVDDDYYDATVPPRVTAELAADRLDDAHPGPELEATEPTPQRTTRRQRLATRQQGRTAAFSATGPAPTARTDAQRSSGSFAAALALLVVSLILGLRAFDRQTQSPPQAGSIPNEVATTPNRAPATARAAQRPRPSPARRRPRPNGQRTSRARQHRRPLRRPAAPSLPPPPALDRPPSAHHAAAAGPSASPPEVEFGLGGY
jgi:hypothetical protein